MKNYFSKNLKFLREQKKLSQNKLAEILDISREHLGGIETNLKHPSFELFFKIAEALDIKEKDLFEFDS